MSKILNRLGIILLIFSLPSGIVWGCIRKSNTENPPDISKDPPKENREDKPNDLNKPIRELNIENKDPAIENIKEMTYKAQYSPDEDYSIQAKALQRKFPDIFIMEGPPTKKEIAITFDDGPDSKTTPEILDILKEHGATATFFIVGENAKRYPKVVKRILDEGHQVANHGFSHLRPTKLSERELLQDINTTSHILNIHGEEKSLKFYRPPYGLLTPNQIELMGNKGYRVISWSIDSLDWHISDKRKIYKKIMDSIHPGAIILMHSAGGKDRRIDTIKALPKILENLLDQGYKPVTVEELLSDE